MRVLVVEDQAELADDIADGLRDQGIGADVAYDGSAAVEKALLNAYDVVVLDRDLPRIHFGENHARFFAAVGLRLDKQTITVPDPGFRTQRRQSAG